MDLLEPKEITVTDGNGKSRTFILSKFPAVQGLEINALYPTSLVMSSIAPKFADYSISQDLMFKIMNYVAVDIKGTPLRLSTMALINNHAGDWETLVKLLWAEVEYNNSFFRDGTISSFFEDVMRKVFQKITEISTQSSERLSQKNSPLSTNSEQPTA